MNSRGSAVVEAGLATVLVTAITAATLCAGYAIFGRAWVEYQSEQALYCLSERQSTPTCRDVFRRSVRKHLPFGHLGKVALGKSRDRWRIDFEWSLLKFKFHVNKSLSFRRILGRAAS